MANALPFIRQPDREAGEASDVSVADLRNQTDEKKIRYSLKFKKELFNFFFFLRNHLALQQV